MSEQLDLLAEVGQMMTELEEALATARSLSALDEPGWSELGASNADSRIAREIDRADVNLKARWYYYNDPIPSHSIHLHNAYTFGRGVGFKAKNEVVQKWLNAFWENPRNQHSISRALAQWTLNRDRQLDGELFLSLYTSSLTGRVTVRTIDPSEIAQVVTMPGDRTFPIYFRREYRPESFDFENGTYKQGNVRREYIPDWRNAGPHPAHVQWAPNSEQHVMHVLSNPLAGRGLSHIAQGLPWVKAYKGFMEDRVTLTLALATFAFKQKIKGNRQALARLREQWGRYETELRYGVGDGRERRQGANTLIENDAVNLEQLKTDSGASNAYTDARMLKQNAGIGSGGIFEHYYGDPSTGNLATATAMELPMLKMFELAQQIWEDVFSDLFTFVLIQGLRYGPSELQALANVSVDYSGGSPLFVVEPLGDETDLGIDVILPNIVESDIGAWAQAFSAIAQAEQLTGQQIIPPEQKAMKALQVFGFDDVGEIVTTMKENGFELSAQGAAPDELGAAIGEAFVRKLRAAADEPPEIGEALDKDEGEAVERIKKSEVDQAFEDFAELPELDELLKQLGLTSKDVEEARAHA